MIKLTTGKPGQGMTFTPCLPPATKGAARAVAAPAAPALGVGTLKGQSGAGMVHMHIGRNRGAWLSVADFLTRQNLAMVLAARASASGKRSADADAGADLSTLPDGNHGDNRRSIK